MEFSERSEMVVEIPQVPEGRLDGQRFFRVGPDTSDERDFFYVGDEPREGYSGSRHEAWRKAVAFAAENGECFIEERTNQRLNDYVGAGVFGLCLLHGKITSQRLSGEWHVGESIVLATYEIEEV